jgi:adenylate cyclase
MAGKKTTRRLTTILAADVVGYSRMMAEDEEATLETLRGYKSVFEAFVNKHDGRIFNTAGDAVLAEFGSTVEAVRCAMSIQEELAARNVQLAESRQMWFRIGINVGDVMIEDGDLFGDGINVAARLEGLAEKGGVCISGSAFDQVKNKLSVAFADIGPQTVKNIPEPVSAFRLVPGRVSLRSDGTTTDFPRGQ